MSAIAIQLFGPVQIMSGPDGSVLKVGRSALGLLAYLVLNAPQPVPREVVAADLWPDCEAERARSRLSTALWRLRKAVEATNGGPIVIDGPDGMLEADPAVAEAADVRRFERHARAFIADAASMDCPGVTDIAAAGEPLAGWYDVWALSARVRLQDMRERCLSALLERQIGAGMDQPAVETAETLLALDPLREDVHQKLIGLHTRHGRAGLAARQYNRCRKALAEELGVEPMPETEALRPGSRRNPPGDPGSEGPRGGGLRDRAMLDDLRRTISDVQRNLARVSSRLEILRAR